MTRISFIRGKCYTVSFPFSLGANGALSKSSAATSVALSLEMELALRPAGPLAVAAPGWPSAQSQPTSSSRKGSRPEGEAVGSTASVEKREETSAFEEGLPRQCDVDEQTFLLYACLLTGLGLYHL